VLERSLVIDVCVFLAFKADQKINDVAAESAGGDDKELTARERTAVALKRKKKHWRRRGEADGSS
jgi:hypothetical protein